MTLSIERQARLTDLIDAVCDATITPEQTMHLEETLFHDREAQWFYLRYLHLHGTLIWDRQSHSEWDALRQMKQQRLIALPTVGATEPSVTPTASVPFSPFPTILPSTIGYSSGWPVSYLLATVITGLLILGFWLMPVSRPEQVATHLVPSATERQLAPEPLPASVGRITGLVDCAWNGGSHVYLGQKCQLASGLMEITYDTGAKVILQGPVTYEVESNGGYLSLGKLTGKLEHSFNREPAASVSVAGKSEIRNQKSEMSAFAVRTPTATVTDLGTEFGVEVREQDVVNVVVLNGAVNIADNRQRATRLAKAGEVIEVRAGVISRMKPGNIASRFVRAIPLRKSASSAWTGTVFSYDFEPPALKPGRLLGQDGWMGIQYGQWDQDAMPSLTVGPGTGENHTQAAGAVGYGDFAHYRRFKWCRQWPQITGASAIVTEEFWAYASTPAITGVVMGATWAPENSPGMFGMSDGKWYLRQAGMTGTEYRGDGGIKARHWYDVKLVIDFSIPGGSATLYYRDVTAGETAFLQDHILHGIEMLIPQVPWGPPAGQYEISGISIRPYGSYNNAGQLYLDNFSIRIDRNGENKLPEQNGAKAVN